MEWIKIEDRQPETVLVNGTTAISKAYLVYTPKFGISFGYMVKHLEGTSHWVIGQFEIETQITHWVYAKEPV